MESCEARKDMEMMHAAIGRSGRNSEQETRKDQLLICLDVWLKNIQRTAAARMCCDLLMFGWIHKG